MPARPRTSGTTSRSAPVCCSVPATSTAAAADWGPCLAQLALLHAIGNPSKPLRHTVGTNVAVIVGVGGLPTWPELLSAIVRCLESNDPDSLEGALDALYKVLPCCWLSAGAGVAGHIEQGIVGQAWAVVWGTPPVASGWALEARHPSRQAEAVLAHRYELALVEPSSGCSADWAFRQAKARAAAEQWSR